MASATGSVALGFIALPVDGAGGGLFYGAGFGQLVAQVVAVVVAIVFTAVLTWIIGFGIHRTFGFRVSRDQEIAGVDMTEHREAAYEFGALDPGYSEVATRGDHKDRLPLG